MKVETQAEIQERYLIPGPNAPDDLYDSWEMAGEIERLQAKFKTAEESIAQAEETIEAWQDFHSVDRKIVGGGLNALGNMIAEGSKRLDKAKEFGHIQARAAEAAERCINVLEEEAGRFYAADGSFERGLDPKEVIQNRIAAAAELEAAKAVIARREESQYARQTARLSCDEMGRIMGAINAYDDTPPDSRERDVAWGNVERALEGLCQGRALVQARAERSMGMAAEEAIELLLPLATKVRQIRMIKDALGVPGALSALLEEIEAAQRRMAFIKLMADAAPEKTAPPMGLVEVTEKAIRTIEEIRDDLEAALPGKGDADAPS